MHDSPCNPFGWSPLDALRRWYRARRMIAALSSLDDSLLKDIGVYRGEIPRLARERHAAS